MEGIEVLKIFLGIMSEIGKVFGKIFQTIAFTITQFLRKR